MKIKGKVRVVQHPITGEPKWSYYPLTQHEAILEDVAKFWTAEICPVHNEQHLVYTKTLIRTCCAKRDAVAAYNEARSNGEPTSVGEAHTQGKDHYWWYEENPHCGHSGKRTLDGKCYECSKNSVSPRQKAIDAAQIWYNPLPTDPCRNGHVAPRRVSNGACKQCEDEAKKAKPAKPVPIYKDPKLADTIIDRNAARELGLIAFRTGKQCSHGRRGWRWVSTGTCVGCCPGYPGYFVPGT